MDLAEAWEAHAREWIAWTRRPAHDSYRFHRDQFLELVPPPGRCTVDVGCGEGRLARDLTALGHAVIAIDASPTLLAAARDADPQGAYHLARATALPLADATADLAIAFMSLHDVDDMLDAVREIARVLEPGGRLCLAIVHPLNSAGVFAGETAEAPFVVHEGYLAERRYADELERDGLRMTFHSLHRPLAAYVRALAAAGFTVEDLREPAIPASAVRGPQDARWRRIPMFLHLAARLTPASAPPA